MVLLGTRVRNQLFVLPDLMNFVLDFLEILGPNYLGNKSLVEADITNFLHFVEVFTTPPQDEPTYYLNSLILLLFPSPL